MDRTKKAVVDWCYYLIETPYSSDEIYLEEMADALDVFVLYVIGELDADLSDSLFEDFSNHVEKRKLFRWLADFILKEEEYEKMEELEEIKKEVRKRSEQEQDGLLEFDDNPSNFVDDFEFLLNKYDLTHHGILIMNNRMLRDILREVNRTTYQFEKRDYNLTNFLFETKNFIMNIQWEFGVDEYDEVKSKSLTFKSIMRKDYNALIVFDTLMQSKILGEEIFQSIKFRESV